MAWPGLAVEADVLQAERAVIGCVLLEGNTRIPPLMPEEFALDAHGRIWRVIQQLQDQNAPVNVLLIRAELSRQGLREPGDDALLAECYLDGSVAPYLPRYAHYVRDAARERALRSLGETLRTEGLDETEIQARLAALPGPLTSALFDPVEAWGHVRAGWATKRIRTGFAGLDSMTGGLGAGEFVIVGGRTGHGKTSILAALALNLAHDGVPVEYVTLEESDDSIVRRLVANMTGIATRRLKDGIGVREGELLLADAAAERLRELPLTVTGLGSLRSIDARAVLELVSQSKARVILVDHLQQINTDMKETRAYGLERVLRSAQSLGIRDQKTVVFAAQLNREVEARKGRPQNSDLRDTGGAEQTARLILLVYWPTKHDDERDYREYEIYVTKQSDGGTGMVPMTFDPACGRFTE